MRACLTGSQGREQPLRDSGPSGTHAPWGHGPLVTAKLKGAPSTCSGGERVLAPNANARAHPGPGPHTQQEALCRGCRESPP